MARSFPAQRHGSDLPPNDILPPPVAPPLHVPAASPQVAAFVDQPVEPNGDNVLVGVGAGGNGPGPSAGSGAAPAPVLLRPPGPSTYPRSTSPTSAPPVAVAFPARVRLKAGLGLLVYVSLAGAVRAAILLVLAGIIARAVGGICGDGRHVYVATWP